MPKPNRRDVPDIRVNDPAEATRKFEDFTRRIMAVPKTDIDREIAKEKAAKKRGKS